jgi:hypothetical protein
VSAAARDATPLEAMRSLRDSIERGAASRFHVPLALESGGDSRLALLEAIPGRRRFPRLLKKRLEAGTGAKRKKHHARLEGALGTCARVAAVLHGSEIRLGAPHTIADELAAVRAAVAAVEPISPRFAATLLARHEKLEREAEATAALPPAFAHGDFSYSQFLFDGETAGLVDFDNVCQAEPARDLGQFLAYLRIGLRKARRTAPPRLTEELCALFLDAYAAERGLAPAAAGRLAERVRIYQGTTLLRLCVKGWLKFKGERLDHALAILGSS